MVLRVALIEPIPIEDELITALSHVEPVGDWGGRLVFYHLQSVTETGEQVCVLKRKLVLPLAGLRAGNPLVRAFINGAPSSPLRVVN